MGFFDELMKIKINEGDWGPRFSLRKESSEPKKSPPPAPAPGPSPEEIAKQERQFEEARQKSLREAQVANDRMRMAKELCRQQQLVLNHRDVVGMARDHLQKAYLQYDVAKVAITAAGDLVKAESRLDELTVGLAVAKELYEESEKNLTKSIAGQFENVVSQNVSSQKVMQKEIRLNLYKNYEEAAKLASEQVEALKALQNTANNITTFLEHLKSVYQRRQVEADIAYTNKMEFVYELRTIPQHELLAINHSAQMPHAQREAEAISMLGGNEAEKIKVLNGDLEWTISPLLSYSRQSSTKEVQLAQMCQKIEKIKEEIVPLDSQLETPQLAEAPQQEHVMPDNTVVDELLLAQQVGALPKEILQDNLSLQSLELILKCAHQLLASDDDVASKLKQKDITPAAMLFFLDLVIITATHAPVIQYNSHAREEEKSLCAIQRFFADEKRRKPSERRMMEHFDKDNHFLQSYVSLEMPQVTIGLDNPVVKAAANALTYMQQKVRAQPFNFFKTTQVNIIDMPSEVPGLEQGADAIEVSARSINHLDLPADIQETIDDLLAFEEKDIAQMSILSP